jgi:hypothetical protein
MAEETITGAENLDNQSSPFDQLLAKSDMLNPARIEQPMAPKVNWQDNFVNPTNYIKDNTAGTSPNFPPSEVKSAQRSGAMSGGFDAILDKGIAKINGMSDMGSYSEPYAYDASPKGAFRDRYKAYGQETFNKIGFHPLIDNETWFNQNTTFGDDIKRWATNSAWPMLTKGFLDPIKSYQSIMNGDGLFHADEQSARDYEYYNAIGASTKGGLGGFTVNLLNSASYSMGILMEGAVEGALIGGIFGGGNAATGALEGGATFARKLGSLPKSLIDATKATGKLMSSVKNYSNLAKAKDLYKSAAVNFGNFINPLHNTLESYHQLKNTDNLTNLARSSVTAGALWHDMMSMNLALSEGKLEGGFTRYQTYDKLYNEFMADPKNEGRAPSLEEQESMMRQASKGAWLNTSLNTGLIFLSNKIAFPSITNASFLKGAPKFAFGKVVGNVGKEFQILFDPGKKALDGVFTKQKISFGNAIKSLAKPSTYGRVGLNYFKANVVEGGQEVSQDVLQEAVQDYYVQSYKNKDARNYRYGAGLLGHAINKQWSSQGLETFASGFLMGTILQAPGKIKGYATMGYNDYFKKDASYQEYIKGREQVADDVVNELNTLYKSGEYFFDPRINNYANQALAANVVDDPDNHTTKEIKDTEFAAFQSAVLSSLQRGTFDMFLNHYKGYKQATPEDIEQAWNLKPGEGVKALERFDKTLENAEKIRDRWGTAKDKMKFMANLDDYEEGSEEYKMAEIYNKAYNQSLYNYVFLHNSYDDNVNRLSKLYQNLSSLSVIKNSVFSDFVGLVDPNRLTQEIEMIKTEVESLESFGTTESLAEASRKRGLAELYSRFQEKQEELVDLFVNKSFLDNIVAQIKQEDPDLTDNQATIKAINKIVDDYDQGKSNEFLEYKEAFSNLLYGMADTAEKKLKLEEEIQNAGGIDTLFDELLDTHILKNENARLIQYVNTLANPREFYEHLMRNFKFMKDLYDNREETIKEIVNGEIEAIENNTLLNTLADQGIYIDLEEFAKWVENKRYLPEEFFDVKNKRVITKGSVLYQDLIDIFFRAAQLAETKPAGDPLSQKQLLDKRIESLENDRGEALQKEFDKYVEAFKKRYGLTPEEYEAQESARVAEEEISDEERKEAEDLKKFLENAAEKLQSDNYIEVQAAAEAIVERIFDKEGERAPQEFFDEQVEIYENDPEKKALIKELIKKFDSEDMVDNVDAALKSQIYGEAVANALSLINETLSKTPAAPTIDVENTKEYLAYQEAIQAINDKFDALISEVKESFRQKGIDENTPDEYTTKTEFDDFDKPFQEEITSLFDEYLVDVLGESIDVKTKDPLEYERLRKNWLEQQSPLIQEFNEKAKQDALDKARKLAEPPQLKFIDVKINAQTTTYTIASLINRFKKFLEDGEYTDPKSNKVMQLTPEDIQNINDDIEALNGYLNARVSAAAPRNIAEQTIEIIQENVINKQDELVDLLDEDGNVIGRTFKDRGPGDPVPDRTTQVAEEVENSLKEKDPFQYSPIKPVVDKEGNVSLSPVERLYNQFFKDPEIIPEDRIRLFMDAFKREAFRGWKEFRYPEKLEAVENSLKTVGTYDDLKKTISKYAFKESADAGDYVDGLIRIFLTPNAATASKFSEFTHDSTVQIKGRDIKVSDIMSRKAFDKLFAPITPSNPGGIVTKFRLGIVDGTYTILSENVKLFDKSLRDGKGVTGEVDLLLIREDGSVAIVDIKTKSLKERKGKLVSGWKDFGNPDAKYESSTYFRAQQSIYGYQFYNNTAITPDLKLMPFDMLLSKEKIGYIEDIDLAEIVEDGKDTIDLEYLPEIENFGIQKITPEIKAPIRSEEAVAETEPGIPESDPTMNTLKDNLNKPVIYNGRTGKLVRMPDGNFGVEVTINNDVTTLQLTLDALQANVDIEKQYGTEESIAELEKDIKRISDAISSNKGFTEIFPLQQNLINVGNGDVTLDKVGLQLVVPIESVGQLSTVKGKTVNASFSNKEETIASINGVRYDVLRDSSGNITTLSYMTNDAAISKLNKEIKDINNKITRLRNNQAVEENDGTLSWDYKQDSIITRIADLQNQVKNLTAKKTSLSESNKKIYLYGENANDYIFALNRLPNNFQRLTKQNTKAQETQDLKSISNLSLSSSIADTITEILSENYPAELDRLFDGTFDYKFSAKPKINKWIDTCIEKLYTLGYTVINRGDLVDDIQNQINALLELKNDLTLIKLTRERKIKNYAEVRKIFTEGQRVQEGTSVPKNERTTRRKTKGVPGPATREELKDLVKQAREESLGDVFDEPVVFEEVSTLSEAMLDDIGTIENIAKLSTIESIYQKAFLEAQKRGEDATELTKAYKKRLQELKTINVVSNIEIGEYLISKKPIFTDISGEIVQVVDIFDVSEEEAAYVPGTQSSVTLKNIKTGEVREFTDNEFVENFEKTTMEATQPEPEVELTPVDVEDSKESKDTIDELIKNGQDAIAEAKEKAKKSGSQSSWSKLGNNSKLC